ncbi:MAG: alkaline phosphatase family protein [Candidatus Tectomicrobia bacterium]|nr:alkaline phosphatase family protein [Candidatus Tectomicrobia bacterium]
MRALVILIDGGDPAYFDRAATPNLDRLEHEGARQVARAQMPTVTNVNNVSMICGAPPARHGITSNYFLDPRTGLEVYMESGKFLLAPTLMERGAAAGLKTAVLASKQKLMDMIGKGADLAAAAEAPPAWLLGRAGKKEEIYSGEVNLWLLRAARAVIEERRPDLLYVTTTDYMQHKYGPEAPEAQAHTEALDAEIGRLVDAWSSLHPDGAVFVTADHGMRDKRRALDPAVILRARGVPAEAVPIIKDRYVVHHGNQGGSAYIHLKEGAAREEALAILREAPGVEEALPRDEAARRFRLLPGRVGDIMALADAETVFGAMEEAEREVSLRSHGSLHEGTVPLGAWNAPFFRLSEDTHHFDATRAVMEGLET